MLVRLSKSWQDLAAIADGLKRAPRELRKKYAWEIASRYYDMLKEHLEKQDLNWPPLSPAYLEWKRKTGLDLRTWIATGELMRAIRIFYLAEGIYLVGIAPDIIHTGSKVPIAMIAFVQEYGLPDRGIPERSLFRVTFHELRGELRDIAKQANKEVYDRYFRSYMGRRI